MKKRILSALVVLSIFIPIFIIGGFPFALAIYIISILGLKEFLDAKNSKKNMPIFIEFISYIIFSLIVLSNINAKELIFTVDFRVLAALFLVYLIPTVLYHDREQYSVTDAFYLIAGIFFLGVSFSLLIVLRNLSLDLIIYLFLITILTDTYAYITGSLIGKNKLLKEISPNKTWEGMIGGTVMGTIISTIFYIKIINPSIPLYEISSITFFLSIIGQFGDLCFSAIKRYFNIKDFSNIMPGHGGVLDRLDSIIFVMLGFMFFISII